MRSHLSMSHTQKKVRLAFLNFNLWHNLWEKWCVMNTANATIKLDCLGTHPGKKNGEMGLEQVHVNCKLRTVPTNTEVFLRGL